MKGVGIILNVNTDNGTIRLTRGDTARLYITIENESVGENYEITSADTLRLTLKKSIKDTYPAFQKVISGTNMFHIEPGDTSNLSFGRYFYDIELTTSDGDVYTIIGPAIFEILKEVSC